MNAVTQLIRAGAPPYLAGRTAEILERQAQTGDLILPVADRAVKAATARWIQPKK